MKTLASSTSTSIVGNDTVSGYFPLIFKQRIICGPENISFWWQRRNLGYTGFQHLVSLRRGVVEPLTCLSSDKEVDTVNTTIENQDTNQSKTVRVKFQLQKECTFGEQFHIIGDDPILGSWEVSNAIPLNWSDGHLWAAELDIPIGKPIQFKFILLGETGTVVWQPGPDRAFQSWETTNTIIVSEDWNNAESQILIEEHFIDQNEDLTNSGEKLIVAENLTYSNDESVHNPNEKPPAALVDTFQNQLTESQRDLLCGSSALEENASNTSPSVHANNSHASEENTKDVILENLSFSNENFIVNSEVFENSSEETVCTLEGEANITEEISKNDDRDDATVKKQKNADIQKSLINYGVPILVPGLPPAPQREVEQNVSVDEFIESKDHKIPETNVKELYIRAEQRVEMKKSNQEEDKLPSEIRQESKTENIENHSGLSPFNVNLLKNDIAWSHKTLLKFFTNLGLH